MDDDQLRVRVQLLEDQRAILGVLNAYGHAIDYGDEERYLDLWTDDGAFDARGRVSGDVARVVRGREALADFAAHFSRPPERWHKHLVIEPLIEVEGDTAGATSYFAVLRDEEADRSCGCSAATATRWSAARTDVGASASVSPRSSPSQALPLTPFVLAACRTTNDRLFANGDPPWHDPAHGFPALEWRSSASR